MLLHFGVDEIGAREKATVVLREFPDISAAGIPDAPTDRQRASLLLPDTLNTIPALAIDGAS